ncbi:probable disease resistance RPP8-like protein 2 [Macadamia integrifolia]|uniref:probable disease resistance RPP8-like protein 2 n=1 Tax=Macadamia integrifolia TaxID=60698 RepID=UPI001C4EB12C|nr:probable disease resistance RPP8-like protein 2 [Macadamia integrifolia]
MTQATLRSYDGRVTFCRIHDLVRDLAISEAKQDRFLEVLGSADLITPNKPRRLSITEPTGGMYGSSLSNALNQRSTTNHPRSLLCFSRDIDIERNMWMKKSVYGAMKLLRVLDLRDVRLSSVPSRLLKHIGKLVLLKYLSLRGSNIEKLPSSIGNLQHLQTLDLGYTTHLTQLPMTMMKLQQLRNLLFASTFGGDRFPQDFDCPLDHMTNLQTLGLHEGKWMDRLDKLTNLRALNILSEEGSSFLYKEALLNAIPKLIHLRGFCLAGLGSKEEALVLPASFSDHLELYRMYLDGIVGIRDFPSNITTLRLSFQIGQRIDELMANLKKLPKLRCLVFESAFLGSKIIFSTHGFHQLEELVLSSLDDLEEFMVEEGALPNLRVLRILECSALKRLPCGLKQVVTLQELTLSGMSEELEYKVRKDIGEDWEIIKHIPSIETQSKSSCIFSRNLYLQWC